jgi:uncharacterized membrane protein YkoI
VTTATVQTPTLSVEEALRIARTDAERTYRELHLYRIEIAFEPDGWHIDYELKDDASQGGGPHYVIDATTGAIVSRKLYQ